MVFGWFTETWVVVFSISGRKATLPSQHLSLWFPSSTACGCHAPGSLPYLVYLLTFGFLWSGNCTWAGLHRQWFKILQESVSIAHWQFKTSRHICVHTTEPYISSTHSCMSSYNTRQLTDRRRSIFSQIQPGPCNQWFSGRQHLVQTVRHLAASISHEAHAFGRILHTTVKMNHLVLES